SERSGPLFARITAADNLDRFKDPSLPLDQRFPQSNDFLGAGNNVLMLYVRAFLGKAVGGDEMVELMGMQFRTLTLLIEVTKEFIATVKKDAPTYLSRLAGLGRMRHGMGAVVAGGLQTLTERETYSPAELTRLISHMRATFPAIVVELAPGQR